MRVLFFSISIYVFKIRMKFNLRQLFLAVSSNCKRFKFSDCRSGIEMSVMYYNSDRNKRK